MSAEGTYKNNSSYYLTADKDGLYREYDVDGQKISEKIYKDGKLIEE